ncbi:MAG: SMP-30/gluconolactonase/LRE family protein [Acidimicrobiales bacterium]
MAERELTTLFEGGTFFEGPRWHDGAWWVSDFYSGLVRSISPDGAATEVMHVAAQPSGIGWMPDGSMLVVSMKDHLILRRDTDGEVTTHADLGDLAGGHLNDMVVDGDGRAYVGNFGFDLMGGADPRAASLVRVDPDGTATVAAEDLYFPNGSVITPDGDTLIVGETMGNRYTAFTIGSDGSLGDRRVWAEFGPLPELSTFAETLGRVVVSPDGCALDAEGHIWAADALANRCVRIAPGGEIVDVVTAPDGLGIFACMLGGPDGTTLLLCAAPDFFEHARSVATEAVLLTTEVAVPHAGLP